MRKEEAIAIIEEGKEIAEQYTASRSSGHRYNEIAEAYQMAINALKREGQRPCRFNPGVTCAPPDDVCYDCGWNPEVKKTRMTIIRRSLWIDQEI